MKISRALPAIAPQPPVSPRAPEAREGLPLGGSSFTAVPVQVRPAKAAGSTVRPATDAVAYIERFHQALGLSGDALDGKNAKLIDDSFGFFRGMPALFISDVKGPFAEASVLFDQPAPQGLIDGDPHLGNFGTLRGPEGRAVWGLDDFDQGGQGPVEWDLERLATSAVLAARQSDLSPQAETQLVRDVAKRYFATLSDFARTGIRPAPSLQADEATGEVAEQIDQADARTQEDEVLDPVTHKNKDGELRLHGKGLDKLHKKEERALEAALAGYEALLPSSAPVARPLRILDLASETGKGGSSYGLHRYLALVADADPSRPPRVLELKQELPSAVSDGTGDLSRADASAAVANQAILTGFLDPLVGSVTLEDGSYLVRELQPQGAKSLKSGLDFGSLDSLASQAGAALARAHAQSLEPEEVAAWIGGSQASAVDNLVAFAETYANQAEADRRALEKAL
jgi:uncharacterized protein (DUF2252 family)